MLEQGEYRNIKFIQYGTGTLRDPLLSHINNQNNNHIHTRRLSLLLLILFSTATRHSYLSLSLIRIDEIASIVIVEGEEFPGTTGEKIIDSYCCLDCLHYLNNNNTN